MMTNKHIHPMTCRCGKCRPPASRRPVMLRYPLETALIAVAAIGFIAVPGRFFATAALRALGL